MNLQETSAGIDCAAEVSLVGVIANYRLCRFVMCYYYV
jgi:hypothetical protein